MNVWALPGPAAFLARVERALRSGTSVVVRFPGRAPEGFSERLLSALYGSWHCAVYRVEPFETPIGGVRERFAPRLGSGWDANLLDLCEHEEFCGRLIWLDGLSGLGRDDWNAWKQFLTAYAQASRSVREFERTLFVAVLEGDPPADPPQDDVALGIYEWRDVIGEIDLLLVAYERLSHRNIGTVARSLLATAVARVAAWDLDVAERLLEDEDVAILDPVPMLRSVACDRGWTSRTAVGWEFGTASGTGVLHAAIAALEDPPREIRRRIWSAQAAVLFPVIDGWRRDFVAEHRALLVAHLRREGDGKDPMDLDVGDLTGLVQRPGFDQGARRHVRQMNNWRNDLAHLKPLSVAVARLLAGF